MSKILVSMDDGLVAKLDAQASDEGVSRSELLSRMVRERFASRIDKANAKRALQAGQRLSALGRRAGTSGDATQIVREMRDAR